MKPINNLGELDIYKNAMLSVIYEDLCDLTNMTKIRLHECNCTSPSYVVEFMRRFPVALMFGLVKSKNYYFVPVPMDSLYDPPEKMFWKCDPPRQICWEKHVSAAQMFDEFRKNYKYHEYSGVLIIKNFKKPLIIIKKVYPNLAVLLSDHQNVFGRAIMYGGFKIEHPTHIFAKKTEYVYINPRKITPGTIKGIKQLARNFNYSLANPFDFEIFSNPSKYTSGVFAARGISFETMYNLQLIVKNDMNDFSINSNSLKTELIEAVSKLDNDCINSLFEVKNGIVKINDQFYYAEFEELKKILLNNIEERFDVFAETIKKIKYINGSGGEEKNRIPIAKPTGLTPWSVYPELYYILKNKLPKSIRLQILSEYLLKMMGVF